LVFCSNCGQELIGAKRFCTKCGYKIEESDLRSLKETPQSSSRDDKYDSEAYPDEDGDEESQDKNLDNEAEESHRYRLRAPPDAVVKEKIPKSTHCLVCNTKTDDICFFCNFAICNKHNIDMQMYADNAKFGNVIHSCSECSGQKNGRQPTTDEASEIGFFFKIKPYHEWKIID